MKKLILLSLAALSLVACSQTKEAQETRTLKVGATPVPHAQLLELIDGDLEAQGIDLEIVEFNDYLTPNLALADGSIDANFFQHEPYLIDNMETNNLDLVSLGAVHIEPLALYSDKFTSIEDLPEGGEILIPNDPTNGARALMLLADNGLISLEDPDDIKATEKNITANPKNFKFTALEAAAIPSSYKDADAAIINSNFALNADLVPTEDGLIIEGKDNPFANIVAVRAGEENDEDLQALIKAFQSDKVKKYIEEEFKGEIIPAF